MKTLMSGLKCLELKEYEVRVTAVTTITVKAASEEEAIDRACETAWEYDADEINGTIVGQEDGK